MSQTHDTTIQETILEQLQLSKVNGFPFFAYTGIKHFVMFGEDTLLFNKEFPSNPNNITGVQIVYDYGMDSYHVALFKQNQCSIPCKEYSDIYFDELAQVISRGMGVL